MSIAVSARDLVTAGATVTIDDGTEHVTYELVPPLESDALCGRLSERSPLGSALIGHGPGERVGFKTPGGLRCVTIVSVIPAY